MTERERRLREYEAEQEALKEGRNEEARGAAAAVGTLGVAAKVSSDVGSEARKARKVEKNREIIEKKANMKKEGSDITRSKKTKYTGKRGTVKSVEGLSKSGSKNMGKGYSKKKRLKKVEDTTPKRIKVKKLGTDELRSTRGGFTVKAKNTRTIGAPGTARADLREAKRSLDAAREIKDDLYNNKHKMSKSKIAKLRKAQVRNVTDIAKSVGSAAKKSAKPAAKAAKAMPGKARAAAKAGKKLAGRAVAKGAGTAVGKAAVGGLIPGVGVALTAMEIADLAKAAKRKKEIERRQRVEEERIRRGINLQ